jgi:toxin FitB
VIVLDTNVVSELMRQTPAPGVARWVDTFPAADVFVTAVTAAELLYGVARLPEGRRKQELFIKVDGLLAEDFRDQVLPFDGPAAAHYAEIVASRESAGRPINMADAQTAAICRLWTADLATRNVDDFVNTGVHVVNPWDTT